jgi:hypothetical protein
MKNFKKDDIVNLKLRTICQHNRTTIKFKRHKILDINSYKNMEQYIIAPINNWNEVVGKDRFLVKNSDCY